jgi:hypothetical protein
MDKLCFPLSASKYWDGCQTAPLVNSVLETCALKIWLCWASDTWIDHDPEQALSA